MSACSAGGERPRHKFFVARPAWLIAILLPAVWLASGCDTAETITSGDTTARGPQSLRPMIDPDQCRDLVDRALNMLHPERLGITADRKTAAGVLNQWALGCGGVASLPAESGDVLERLLAPEVLQRLRAELFSGRDCSHVRNCLLMKAIVDFAGAVDSDLERVGELFDYVVRNVQLEDQPPEGLPLTPYEILLFGRGAAEDRAWVFAELLKQLRLDAIVLRPADGTGAEIDAGGASGARAWLVGIPLDGEIYLFDVQLGLAIPRSEDASPTSAEPATLDDVLKRPELLRALDIPGGEAYPLTADGLQSPSAELIGHAGWWSPRMKGLQAMLSGEQAVVVHDALAGSGPSQGALARIAEVGEGRWTAEAIALWPHAEQRMAAFENLDQKRPQDLYAPLRAPLPIVRVEYQVVEGNPPTARIDRVEYGATKNDLLSTRTEQILGEFDTAVQRYTTLRGVETALVTGTDAQGRTLAIPRELRAIVVRNLPPAYRSLHRLAAEDAAFWAGISQLESGDRAGGLGTLAQYANDYPAGHWIPLCQRRRAELLAAAGRLDEAVAILEEFVSKWPDVPGRHGDQWRLARWKAAAKPEAKSAE
ncbi:MAG: tetratricopeptide repeat protein [Planctomycetes bacterium]|nr:tetratricopeptide repeat protein [Planctomycetota bacterium]